MKLAEKGFLKFLLEILKNEESYEIINSGLDCFRNLFDAENYSENILNSMTGKKYFLYKFIEEKGDELMEQLQCFKNELIYEKTINLIEDFFESID